jgi:hypothetical protein
MTPNKTTTEAFADIIKSLLNKPIAEVKKTCVKAGWTHRVVSYDGEPMVCTRDVNDYRMNFVVNKDVVTEITMG